jgi:putative MATE family efflux protein
MRHVLVMTSASSVGLLAMFGVDVVDLYFLTLLGQQEIVAAVGFAATLLYFLLSLGIGLQIALGALVARAEGSGERARAGRYCSSALFLNTLISALLAALVWLWLPDLLRLLGASGRTLEYALAFARIQLPAVPVLVLGMSFGAGLRAVGDARRYMLATVAGAVVNGLLDPLFIFHFGWGIEGAAWASVASRVVVCIYTGRILFARHRLPQPVRPAEVLADVPAILAIALPAVLTNLATPLGNSLVLRIMAQFGDGAVAAMAILARLAPVAFAAVFALSGAIGPIVGQNAGACRYDRVREALLNASWFIVVYVAVVWLLLQLLSGHIADLFAASEMAAELLHFYLAFLVWAFALNGMLFISNASFNNLGLAYLATLFNYAKVLLGIVPAAWFCARHFDASGVLLGEALGMAVWGLLGLGSALWLVSSLQRRYPPLQMDAESATASR